MTGGLRIWPTGRRAVGHAVCLGMALAAAGAMWFAAPQRARAQDAIVPIPLAKHVAEPEPATKPPLFADAKADKKDPITIKSNLLTVLNDQSKAIFEGHVDAVQGNMRLRTEKLEVFYVSRTDGDPAETKGPKTASISHMKAVGNVVFISPTEMAQGDWGIYDVRKRTIELHDNVVVTQGDSVLRGSRLDMDLNTGRSTLRASSSGKRVVGRFVPGEGEQEAPATQ